MKINIKKINSKNINFVIGYCCGCENKIYSLTDFQQLKDIYFKKINTGKYWCFIAQTGNQAIGYVDIEIREIYGEEQLWVNELYVKDDYRCKGIGTKLMNHISKFARRNNFNYIFASTEIDNIESKRVLEKTGYKQDRLIYIMEVDNGNKTKEQKGKD